MLGVLAPPSHETGNYPYLAEVDSLSRRFCLQSINGGRKIKIAGRLPQMPVLTTGEGVQLE